ncbi:hypothetical protein SCP_0408600 [Sparassis crispa]|uniref:Tyr recombinase domain-containing protein n=1 Tax=Sparassis crispa TaxID=139825 RepID=A0A401GJX9_9APHY|nr:hypothetical protein SCP_0408600 [Sparassis crispa]GBE82476.1 hypothetical protein SCP_0408600 [Sparassis crispa]
MSLTPLPSPLRPHCLARERLHSWRPPSSRRPLDAHGAPVSLSAEDIARIEAVTAFAWSENTAESYGSGLLVFHVFYDTKDIPESKHAPASSILMASFIATLAGAYAGKTIGNYVAGVRAWHLLHGLPWIMEKNEMDVLLKSADILTLSSSKRIPREPFTIEILAHIHGKLSLSEPLDAAVWACLTTAFYAVARVGEVTVQNLTAFDPALHVKRSDIRVARDRNGFEETVFHLPVTKAAPHGEDIFWARQNGLTDLAQALENHFAINRLPADAPLFTYRHGPSSHPLTRQIFLQHVSRASKDLSHNLHGHSIRIGGTLEYLLRGIAFEVVKSKGRWQSNTFTLYLRKHAQVMAPYMQAVLAIHEALVRYSMPPVR